MKLAIPIFAFHRIGPRHDCRFTVPPDVFEQYLTVVEDEGFIPLTASDLVAFIAGQTPSPRRACLLTFDDGTADFWVYAAPLLRRHRMRATVFVILNRLQHEEQLRPTLEDVWSGRCGASELYQLPEMRSISTRALDPDYRPVTDHLSWEEALALVRDGTCDVQSHGLDHMVQYTSHRLRGFLNPLSHWMARAAAGQDVRLGTPIYETSSTLVRPRYCDPVPIRNLLADVVAGSGGDAFFSDTKWQDILQSEFCAATRAIGPGALEPEEVWERAVLDGLRTSIALLSDRTGASVNCLAWPFGASSAASQAIALKAGFTIAFTTQCGGYVSGMHPARVGRVSLKDHDVVKFRHALRHYSNADAIGEELAHAVYGGPIEFAV